MNDLMGREAELAILRATWQKVRGGSGQTVLVSGEPGIGKSRLIQQFVDDVVSDECIELRYECSPQLTNSAFHPVVQHLTQAAGFVAGDDSDSRLEKLEALLSEVTDAPGEFLPLLASLLSISSEHRFGALELTPAQLRFRTIEALIELVIGASQRGPLLVVLEDAHWIDPSMNDLIGELMPRITRHPVLMLISYRLENAPQWPRLSNQATINLQRIDNQDAASIVRAVAGQALLNTIIERIVTRAEGVPLYVEELTKSVLESFSDSLDPATNRLIPASLHSSLVTRLERLGDACAIAQAAAVIGREFSADMLLAISSNDEAALHTSLDQLVVSGLIFKRDTEDGVRYVFKHALVRDAAYSMMPDDLRLELHGRIVSFVEQQSSQKSDELIDLLAHHASLGKLWDQAFNYLQQSGQRAIDRAAIREAVAQFEQALDAGMRLPETPRSLEHAIDLRFDLRNALWSIGQFERILTQLDDAQALAERRGDPVRIGWISVFRSASYWQLGRSREALDAAKAALEISESADDLSLWVGSNFYLGCAYVTSGDCRSAETYFEKIVDALTGDLRHDRCGLPFVPAVIARSWLLWALAERGEFKRCKVLADEALQIAQRVGHPFNLAHIYYDIGYFHEVKGEIDLAVDALGKAYDLIREWNLSYLSPFISGFFGHACALSGNVNDGVLFLERAVAEYRSVGLGLFRSLVTMQLGEAHLLADDVEQARLVAEQALALALERGERGHEAWTHRLLAQVAMRSVPPAPARADEHYHRALELASELEMRPLEAHCQRELAEVHELTGNVGKAGSCRLAAAAIYQEIGMLNPG